MSILIFSAAFAISAADAPRVTRSLMVTAEKGMDERITQLWPDNGYALVGPTRGVYIPGYGVVLSAEYNVATAQQTLGAQPLTVQGKADLRKKKVGRLPELKAFLRSSLAAAANTFDMMPASEQIVITLLLPRYSWEETSGFPAQLVAQGSRQQLLDANRAGAAALEQAVRMTEY
ncbi:MAG: hypothetical protein ABI824_09650 [Acidobacteriota bacterium]